MTILEILADLGVVGAIGVGADTRPLLTGPSDLEVRVHEGGGLVVGDDEAVVTVAGADLGAALDALGDATKARSVVLALATELGALDIDAVLARLGDHGLEVRRAVPTTYATLPTALVVARSAGAAGPQGRVRLQQGVIAALRAQEDRSRAAAGAVGPVRAEADRRAARIKALTAEVDELRNRLRAAGSTHSREVAARDQRVAALERRVRDLERSVSYRLGHALVRLVKEPMLLLRIPGRLVAMLRSRFRR